MDGISMAVGKKALGVSAKALAAAAEATARAALEAEMADRPDASPRPNNLDFHEGFRRVGSNVFLRRVGASLGVLDEADPSTIATRVPELILGPSNLYVAAEL